MVPMLILLGISHEMDRCLSIGDSAINIITPLMVTFPLILILNAFELACGHRTLGSLTATTLPYSIGDLPFCFKISTWCLTYRCFAPGAEVFIDALRSRFKSAGCWKLVSMAGKSLVSRVIARTAKVIASYLFGFCALGIAHRRRRAVHHAGTGVIDPRLTAALLAEMDRTESALVQKEQDELLAVFEAQRSFTGNLIRYVSVGLGHILPSGLDHILFVVAMFLAAKNLRSLFWLITTFTLAHSVTLALPPLALLICPGGLWNP